MINKFELATIYFRLANVEDAEFILNLRTDEGYAKYLTQTENDLYKQQQWIVDYKQREELKIEYYFIICLRENDVPIGTVRIYDFIPSKNSFCWGSWILNHMKTRYAAIECAILIYDFAFEQLGFDFCHMDIRKENLKVIDFHKKMGVKIIGETDLDYQGLYEKSDYLNVREDLLLIVNKYGNNSIS